MPSYLTSRSRLGLGLAEYRSRHYKGPQRRADNRLSLPCPATSCRRVNTRVLPQRRKHASCLSARSKFDNHGRQSQPPHVFRQRRGHAQAVRPGRPGQCINQIVAAPSCSIVTSTSTPSTRRLLDSVAVPDPHRSTEPARPRRRRAPNSLVDLCTGTHSIVVAGARRRRVVAAALHNNKQTGGLGPRRLEHRAVRRRDRGSRARTTLQ